MRSTLTRILWFFMAASDRWDLPNSYSTQDWVIASALVCLPQVRPSARVPILGSLLLHASLDAACVSALYSAAGVAWHHRRASLAGSTYPPRRCASCEPSWSCVTRACSTKWASARSIRVTPTLLSGHLRAAHPGALPALRSVDLPRARGQPASSGRTRARAQGEGGAVADWAPAHSHPGERRGHHRRTGLHGPTAQTRTWMGSKNVCAVSSG